MELETKPLHTFSRATLRRMSLMRVGDKNPFWGKHHTAEFRAAQSLRTRAYNLNRTYDIAPLSVRDPVEWAQYVAGVFDGEGSLRFARGCPTLYIHNTHKPLMDELQNRIGGYVMRRNGRGRCRPCYCWAIGAARDVALVLKRMLPFLIVKRKAAKEMLHKLEQKYGERLWQK